MAKHEVFRVFGEKVKKVRELMAAGYVLKFEEKTVEGHDVGIFYVED